MSWNLIILPREDPDLDDVATLGDVSEVRARLASVLSPIDWSDPGSGVFEGDGFRIEIALQADGQVPSFMLHVTGQGEPMPVVIELCRKNGWELFDSVAGDYIDIENPSDLGWKGYHAHIEGKVVPPDEQ